MRVLMITPELPRPDRPGSMAPTARQIASLRDVGIDVEVVEMRGIPKLKYLQVIPRVRALAKQVDLIHAHFGYCGWLARVQRRVPVIVSFMGDDLLGTPNNRGDRTLASRIAVRTNIRLARRVAAVIVKSHEMARVLSPLEPTVIPNGVDLDTFAPQNKHAARTSLDLNPDSKLVLFPGDPNNPNKGFALASTAVEDASRRLRVAIELLPLWGVAPDQVATYMNACDAMLMTSLTEGSPNVVKEAMACDLPVVAVPVGDVAELLHGVDGCAVCAREPSAIGQQLARSLVVDSPTNGRQVILRKKLDIGSVAKRVIDVYAHVLGTASSNHTAADSPHRGEELATLSSRQPV